MSNLQLLAPIGLLALIGIPLVILYHMRRDTPRTWIVPTTRFWLAAEPAMTEKPRFKIPPITVPLLLQLAAVALLGFALARPAVSEAFGSVGKSASARHLIVVLDGSTSMAATLGGGSESRWDSARRAALDAVGELQTGDIATVMVIGANPVTLQGTDESGLRSLRNELDALPLPGGEADLNAALSLASALLMPELQDEVLVLTDGAVQADPSLVASIAAPVELQTFTDQVNGNLAITAFAARADPAQPDQFRLFAQIANFSDETATTTYSLVVDRFEVDRQSVTIEPGEAAEVLLQSMPADSASAVLSLLTSDIQAADNSATLVMSTTGEQEVLVQLVSDSPATLERALTSIPGVRVLTASTSEYLQRLAPVANYDLAVFEGMLPPQGTAPDLPTLFIAPPFDNWPTVQGMMTAPVATEILSGDPLLNGPVDLAGVTFGDTPVHELTADQMMVVGSAEGPLLYRGSAPESGAPMIVMPFSLADSNLPKRLAFPMLMTNIVYELTPPAPVASLGAGELFRLSTAPIAATVEVTDPNGETQVLVPVVDPLQPEAGGEVSYARTGTPGEYRVTVLDSAGEPVSRLVFVVLGGSLTESNLSPNPVLADVMATSLSDQSIGSSSRLNDLWPLLIALGLLVVVAEWLYAQWSSRRRMRGAR